MITITVPAVEELATASEAALPDLAEHDERRPGERCSTPAVSLPGRATPHAAPYPPLGSLPMAHARHNDGMDEWLDQDAFGRALGHQDGRTLAGWRARGVPASHPVPPPDDVVVERGHARPRWRRSTVDAYLASRPGRGRTAA